MHEMGVVRGIVGEVQKQAKFYGVSKVGSVSVTIGALTGIIPRYVHSCWNHACDGTILEGSELYITEVKGIVVCDDCKEEYNPMENIIGKYEGVACPKCRSEKYTVKQGLELMIDEIGVPE